MRKRVFTTALVFALLALGFSATSMSPTAKAEDPCVYCQASAQIRLDACEAALGPNEFCYDQYNRDIVVCYATLCEQ